MTNHARGYAAIDLAGDRIELALSLGALAELEAEFGVESFEDALNFGDRVSAVKLRKFMRALLRGNSVDYTAELDKAVNLLSLQEFMAFVGDLLTKSGFAQQAETPKEGDGAPLADATAGEPG